jgi:hypothetical protein
VVAKRSPRFFIPETRVVDLNLLQTLEEDSEVGHFQIKLFVRLLAILILRFFILWTFLLLEDTD